MFMNLNADVAHRLEASTMASFLEIYGEDVYDLLSDGHAPGIKRASLQVRYLVHCSFFLLRYEVVLSQEFVHGA